MAYVPPPFYPGAVPVHYPGAFPVVTQPGGPHGPHLPGLDYLAQVDQLFIYQQVEFAEQLSGYETDNQYMVVNPFGQTVFWAAEYSSSCARCCCGGRRAFEMSVLDVARKEVFHLSKSCGCCCRLNHIKVTDLAGDLGEVSESCRVLFCRPTRFDIYVKEERVARIYAPCCTTPWSTCQDIKFEVWPEDSDLPGRIMKVAPRSYQDVLREKHTDADIFHVTFPPKLTDVKARTVILAAAFLIDFMFYEQKGTKRMHRQQHG